MTSQTDVQHIGAAVKRHRCDWCFEFVLPGEPYARWRWFGEGDARSVRVHEECLSAINAADPADMLDGWTPGDCPRGCNCGHADGCERCAAINLIRYLARGGAFA